MKNMTCVLVIWLAVLLLTLLPSLSLLESVSASPVTQNQNVTLTGDHVNAALAEHHLPKFEFQRDAMRWYMSDRSQMSPTELQVLISLEKKFKNASRN